MLYKFSVYFVLFDDISSESIIDIGNVRKMIFTSSWENFYEDFISLFDTDYSGETVTILSVSIIDSFNIKEE